MKVVSNIIKLLDAKRAKNTLARQEMAMEHMQRTVPQEACNAPWAVLQIEIHPHGEMVVSGYGIDSTHAALIEEEMHQRFKERRSRVR